MVGSESSNKKYKSINIVRLNIDDFYDNNTKPEGRVFTFSRRYSDESLSYSWKIAHWEEIFGLLADKYYLSERQHENCGLINAAKDYFCQEQNRARLFEIVGLLGLSLPEMSLVIKEGNESKIFIPNLSISNAKERRFATHDSIEKFISSESGNLIMMISQFTASNPDYEIPHVEQTLKFARWTEKYGAFARKDLRESLKFGEEGRFVEGISPDEVLKKYGHLPYEDIA